MSYSRRQLYAMGEPFGECATRKEGGRIIYGGGDSTPAVQTQVSDLPDWAKPYAQQTLGQAASLTDISQNPYQAYTGQRTAQFSPLQKAAYGSAMGMNAGPQGFAQNVGAYMSPYMQNVVDREKLAAARDSQILGQQQQAQATQAGAFGGYREGIQRAERERGLRSSLQDIQARGTQAAYDQAANQFRQGIGQQLAINQQQGLFGTQQQQNVQNMLDTQYQDFLNQKRYPYQQLEFMSNILRGTPMGTVNTLYGAGPTMGQQVGALGMGMYGYNQMFGGKNAAEGGVMESYAEGGVTSDQNVESILDNLSIDQLKQSRQIALANRDMARVEMIDKELAQRASENRGLGFAFNQLSPEQQEGVMSAAGGGIVAFAGDDDDNDPQTGQLVSASYAPGSPADYQYFLNKGKELFDQMGAVPEYKAMTPKEQAEARAAYLREVQEGAGPSPYKTRLEGINAERAALTENLNKAKGIGAFRAANAMLQGRGFMRGLGNAGEAFAATYEKAEAANRAENRALRDMEFNLLDAQRKERMGLNKEATAAMREVERDRAAAAKHRKDGLAAQANLARGMAAATKPYRPTGAGGPKPLKVPEQLAAAELKYARDPSEANLKDLVALRQAADRLRTSDVGPVRAGLTSETTDAGTEAKILGFVNDNLLTDSKYREAARMPEGPAKDLAVAAAIQGLRAKALTAIGRSNAPAAAPPPAPAPAPAPAASAPRVNANSTPRANSATVEGLPAGATVRGNQVFDHTGKLIGRVE